MKVPGRIQMLALLAALVAAPGHAQDTEKCPHPQGWRPSSRDLQTILRDHKEWVDKGGGMNPALPGRAVLCNADLFGAQLQDADLLQANLQNANLSAVQLQGAFLGEADLRGANLRGAQLQGADLFGTSLQNALLVGSNLQDASLLGVNLTNAQLAYVNLANAVYAPVSPPPNSHVAGIRGLSSVVIPTSGDLIGFMQLRKLLQGAGLPEEREATYAIERNKTRHLLFGEPLNSPEEERRWRDGLRSPVEGAFRWLAFELPVGYGLYPGRALLVLLASIGGFALVYAFALATGTGRVYRVWPQGRVEEASDTASLAEKGAVERLQPGGMLRPFIHALQFSLLSAFHLGFRELNVGSWLARLQGREYGLQAVGWVRRVAGLQSLLSVYLLALWVLTYFGRPFG